MKFRKSIAVIGVCSAATMVLGACGGDSGSSSGSTAQAQPKAGGSLTVGLEAGWVSLDPIKANSISSYDVLLTMYEQLFDLDKDGKLVPSLAESVDASDDGLTYTVKLKTGVKFQDGTPFDAAAVKANLDRYRDPANACVCYSTVQMVTDVTAKSADTVEIKLSEPNAGFPKTALAMSAGMMASPAAFATLGTTPVGTGAFTLKDQVADSSIEVTAWKDYREPERPYLDSITFKVIPDVDARYASLQSNAIDIADNVSFNSLDEAEADSKLKVEPQGAVGSLFVMMNTNSGALMDPKARAAACMAINPSAINDTLFSGKYTVGQQSPFPVNSPDNVGKVSDYPSYDAKKAKKAVSDLGGLSFSLQVSANPDNLKIAQALQAQWKTAGIEVTIDQMDQPTLIQHARTHNFDAMYYRWRGSMDPDGNVAPWFSSALATPNAASTNYTLVNNPKVDELIKAGQTESDPAARKKVYTELSGELAKVMPYCYLWGADWYRVAATDVYGIPPRPDDIMNPTDAYVNAG